MGFVNKEMVDQGVLWTMFLAALLVGIPAVWGLMTWWLKDARTRTAAVDVERRQREEQRDVERAALIQQLIGLTEKVTTQGAIQTEVMRAASAHIAQGNMTHDRFVDLVTRLIDKLDIDSKALGQRLEIMHGELRQVLQLQTLEITMPTSQKKKAKNHGHRPRGSHVVAPAPTTK